jgi:hypothetical protein
MIRQVTHTIRVRHEKAQDWLTQCDQATSQSKYSSREFILELDKLYVVVESVQDENSQRWSPRMLICSVTSGVR